jgi:hypothetical protein
LPANATFIENRAANAVCLWECEAGFYIPGGETPRCASCDLIDAAAACDASQQLFWMGCGGQSQGRCVNCTSVVCTAGLRYRVAPVTASSCYCVDCAAPVLGRTYIVARCTPLRDTVLAECRACVVGVQYRVANCTLTVDTVCLPCTAPLEGRLRLAPCSATTDAIYGACPVGRGCDGGPTAFDCVAPQIASANGTCVCPLGRTGPFCDPIPCPNGFFPSSLTGTCQPCGLWATPTSAGLPFISQAGLKMDMDACGCPVGYLREPTPGPQLECWPCGDLGCVSYIEQQTPCDGFGDLDPTCECHLGPGMRLDPAATLSRACAVQCAPGFEAVATALAPGRYDDFGFLSGLQGPLVRAPKAFCHANSVVMKSVLLRQGGALLVLCGDGALTLLGLDTLDAPTFSPSMLTLFGRGNTLIDVTGLDLTSHGTKRLWAWLLYGFRGFCGADYAETGDPTTTVAGDCVAVQLLSVTSAATASVNCARDGLCLSQNKQWGRTFAVGIPGLTGLVVWTPWDPFIEGALLVWVIGADNPPTQVLYRYPIVFYAETGPDAVAFNKRDPDPPIALALPADMMLLRPRALSVFDRTLFVLLDPHTTNPNNNNNQANNAHGVRRLHCGATGCEALAPLSALTDLPPLAGLDVWTTRPLLVMQTRATRPARLYAYDPWNELRSMPHVETTGVQLWAGLTLIEGVSTLVGLNATTLYRVASVTECPVDAFASSASDGGCVPMPCTRAATCDPVRGVRRSGQTACACVPGYYVSHDDHVTCMECAPATYCPGDSVRACPPNAISSAGAALASDCVCLPGYYVWGAGCVLCPSGTWCPFNHTLAPIVCVGGASDNDGGKTDPLDCVCPARTYGLNCLPCDAAANCNTVVDSVTLIALRLVAYGPIATRPLALFDACFNATDAYTLYSVLGIGTQIQTDETLQLNTDAGLLMVPWDWILVLRAADALVVDPKACLQAHGFVSAHVETLAVKEKVPIRRVSSCGGRHLEWDASGTVPDCVCVAGYELVYIDDLFDPQCLPCMNGTARARYAPGGCVPCLAPQSAPFLGMTQCTCIEGFRADSVTGVCVPTPPDPLRTVPAWYPWVAGYWHWAGGGLAFGALAFALGCVWLGRVH